MRTFGSSEAWENAAAFGVRGSPVIARDINFAAIQCNTFSADSKSEGRHGIQNSLESVGSIR